MYYFASDMHLTAQGKNSVREQLFIEWLEKVSKDAEAIFILGDMFDFWYEYSHVIPKGFSRLLGKLSELTDKGVEIHLFRGNHDLWAYDYLQSECGVILHSGYGIFYLNGRKVFVAHGDNMNPDAPLAERIMNSLFRSKAVQWIFTRLLHPDLTMRFGMWWSQSSRKSKSISHRFRGEDELLVKFAKRFNDRTHIDYFVFGHTHCAENYPIAEESRAVFLGEWIEKPLYAVLDYNGNLELKSVKG